MIKPFINVVEIENLDRIYNSVNYGDFKIIEKLNTRNSSNAILYKICFIETNGFNCCTLDSIKRGTVKDLYKPNVFGVGYIGEGVKSKEGGVQLKEYILWKHMLERCYSEKLHKRYPTYACCTVSEEWHNFQNFYNDIKKLHNYDKWKEDSSKYSFDKDIKLKDNKIYSFETCMFVSQYENSKDAAQRFIENKKPYMTATHVLSKKIYEISNLEQFCRDNNISCITSVYKAIKGNKEYKGFFFKRN